MTLTPSFGTLVTALLVAPAGSQTEWVDYFLSDAPLSSPLLAGLLGVPLGIFWGGLMVDAGLPPV